MEPMKNELKTKRKEIKEAIEKINEAVNGKPVMKNGIKDSLEEEFDCIEGPIGMDLEATTAEKITPKNSTPAAAASKMAPRKVPEISPVDYKYKNNGPIKFQTQNTRYFHISLQNFENPKLWINAKFQLEPDQKACKEVNIEKVKWDEGPIEFYETGLDVDKTEIHTPKVLSSSKLTASAK